MSENQYLEIIENKLDVVSEMVAQQSKSGVFFDGFTKDVLEKIHNKLDYISNFETNELISYLTDELKKNLEDRHNLIQHRLDGVQGQLNIVQANLGESLKNQEITEIFTKLSDSVLNFSRDLNAQTRYFNSTIENVQSEIGQINIDEKLNEQTGKIKEEISDYKETLENLVVDVNSSFNSVKALIEEKAPSQAILALSGDISVVQKGLNDVVNSVIAMNNKHGELVQSISNIAANADMQDIKLDVSSIVAEMQILKDAVRILVNKSDIEALNEKINIAIETTANLKEFSAYHNDETKNTVKTYFNDLSGLLSTLVSKEESELIKEKLETIQLGIESGKNNLHNIVSEGNNEIKNLIPIISSLSTKENVRELTENAIQAVNAITEKWNEGISQSSVDINNKLDSFRDSLTNIGSIVTEISPKLQEFSSQNELKLKEELNNLSTYVSSVMDKITASAGSSISELTLRMQETSSVVSEQIKNIEIAVNSSQDGLTEKLKNSLSENIDQLKEFSQKLIESITSLDNKISLQSEDVKQVVNSRYNLLEEKISELKNLYSASNVENKTEIINSIDSLRTIVEAAKSVLDNNNTYEVLTQKIESIETTFANSKNEILSSGIQVAGAISNQADLLEAVNNSIKDLYINISDGKSVSLGNKTEIIDTINQKIYDVTAKLEEAKNNINNGLSDNKESLVQEFAGIQSITNEIKNILLEVNENQASKQILAAILENVTEKTDSVKVLISENKDFNLEQYDAIKELTNGLKRDISDVVLILNQSQEFTRNMIEKVSASFAEVSSNIEKQTAMLKQNLEGLALEQKTEFFQKLDVIDEQIKRIQTQIEGFNFDESVKEQLLDLKRQIEAFNKESLIGILNSVTENNQLTTDSVKETMSTVKTDLTGILNGIEILQYQSSEIKSVIASGFEENFNKVVQKLDGLSENIETNSYNNKEEILNEINELKNITDVLRTDLKDNFEVLSGNNKQDIVDLLDSNTKNLENLIKQMSSDFQGAASDNRTQLCGLINALQAEITILKENISGNFEENLSSITQKLEYLSNNVETNSQNNKQQIIEEVNNLKTLSEELKVNLDAISDGLPKETFITEQTGRISDLIIDFSHNVQSKLLELGNADKDYIYQAVQEAFVSFEQQISDSLNYLKGVSLNLDRNFTGTKEELLSGMNSVQMSFGQFKDNFQSEIQSAQNGLKEALSNNFESLSVNNKQELINSFANNIKDLEDKLIQLKAELLTSSAGNKTELNSSLQSVQIKIDEAKENIEKTLQSNSSSVSEKLDNLSASFETISSSNSGQILNGIEALKNSSEVLKSSIQENIENLGANNKLDIINSLDANSKKLEDKISQVFLELQNSAVGVNTELNDILQNVKEEANNVKNDIADISCKLLQREDVAAELDRVDMALSSLSTSISTKLDEIIEDNSDSALSELQSYVLAIKSDIASVSSSINQSKNEIIEAFNAVNADIESKFNNDDSKINTFVSEVKSLLDTSLNNVSSILEQDKIDDNEFKETLSLELKKSINEVSNKLLKAGEDNSELRSELLYELQKSYNILNEKLDNQNGKTDEIKTIVDESLKTNISDIEDLIEQKYTKLQSNVIKDVAEMNFEEIKAELCQDIAENAVSIKERLNDVIENLSQNKDAFEILAKNNHVDILEQISQIKTDILNIKPDGSSKEIIPEIQGLADKIQGISDDILDAISNDLDASFSENIKNITETVEDKISLIKDDIQEVVYKISEVDTVVERVKEIVTMQFEDFLDTFNSKFTMIGNDVKNLIELKSDKITAVLEEYQKELKGLSDIDLKEYSEDTKLFVQEQIQILKDKIEEIKNQNEAGIISDDIKETITSSSNIINKRLELLRDMILSEMPSNDEISESFEEIKAAISSVGLRTEGFADVIRNENASLRDIIKSYQAQINELAKIDESSSTDEATRDFIREELKQLKEQFVRNLTGVFENISFIEESEEIQNVIFDNVSEIKDEILKLKKDIIENSNSGNDVDEKFDKLKDILESITSGTASSDSSKYIYTLPDVETDIAKMRMAINDISDMLIKNKEDGYDVAERLDSIDDIREDISSISKRTNKLILTSDDVNKYLKENITEFKKIMDDVSDKCNRIDSTQLNRNIVDVKALVMSGLKSDQILNEAFMHLAEWIDDSARTMNAIDSQIQNNAQSITGLKSDLSNISDKTEELYNKTDEISVLKDAISELAVKLDKKSDIDYSKSLYEIEYGLDKLSDKLDVQELKIKSLEKKIESLSSSQSGNEEISSILEFIASQVSAANENSRSNKLLLQKVEMMEKQMEQFESNISKITAFVDSAN